MLLFKHLTATSVVAFIYLFILILAVLVLYKYINKLHCCFRLFMLYSLFNTLDLFSLVRLI